MPTFNEFREDLLKGSNNETPDDGIADRSHVP